jgi:hypothetical protein
METTEGPDERAVFTCCNSECHFDHLKIWLDIGIFSHLLIFLLGRNAMAKFAQCVAQVTATMITWS